MKYLVLLIGDGELKPWTELSPEEQGEMMEQFGAFDEACRGREGVEILSGEALGGPQDSTTVRTRGGQVQLTDGPYAEAVEGLGGFYLVESPDLDVLLDLLTVLPPYDMQVSPVDETPASPS
ncbi:MAG: YciI family protein [Nocardioides sp.]|nr:YciI family protein [Nocardioides sp.]